ncbi:MAG: exosortase system-associated protein, TIGR04073 family [Pseudomonadota bacterium]
MRNIMMFLLALASFSALGCAAHHTAPDPAAETASTDQAAPSPTTPVAEGVDKTSPTARQECGGRPACPMHHTNRYWTEGPVPASRFIRPSASYPEKVFRKLGRGAANVVTAPLEVANQPLNYLARTQTPGLTASATALAMGLPAGVLWAAYRAVAGAFDLATFLIPPFQPLIQPEFVSNELQRPDVLQLKNPNAPDAAAAP